MYLAIFTPRCACAVRGKVIALGLEYLYIIVLVCNCLFVRTHAQ